jgi:hypothetical protein
MQPLHMINCIIDREVLSRFLLEVALQAGPDHEIEAFF